MEAAVLTGKGPMLKMKELGLESNDQHGQMAAVKYEDGLAPMPPEGLDLSERLQFFEKHYIKQALKMAKGNESKAARLLQMNHHTFRYRRRKLRVE